MSELRAPLLLPDVTEASPLTRPPAFSPVQRTAARLSAMGVPRREIARRVRRSVRQVHRWHDREDFHSYVDSLRWKLADELGTELALLALHAFAVVHDVLNDEVPGDDPRVEVAHNAINWILERAFPPRCQSCGSPIRRRGGVVPEGVA